jgi:hypothetical protein
MELVKFGSLANLPSHLVRELVTPRTDLVNAIRLELQKSGTISGQCCYNIHFSALSNFCLLSQTQ